MPARRRVTAVNDSRDFLDLVTEVLEARGCKVATYAAISVEFEEIIRSDPELLIVDLRLEDAESHMSGWEIITLTRADDRLRMIPLILCTADAQAVTDRREELATMAGVHVLTKPFKLVDFEALVEKLLTP
jgi:CheY-like chemotaxis protein